MREKEIFYKSKLSLTPMRKVASYVGRLCEEGIFGLPVTVLKSPNVVVGSFVASKAFMSVENLSFLCLSREQMQGRKYFINRS